MSPDKIKNIALALLIIIAIIIGRFGSDSFADRDFVTIGQNEIEVDVAKDPEAWRFGLSKYNYLEAGQGMLFVYPEDDILTFWMKDMKFNIDLLWIDDYKIIAWQKNMPAPPVGIRDTDLKRYRSPRPVDMVLELPAGSIDRMGIKINDKIEL